MTSTMAIQFSHKTQARAFAETHDNIAGGNLVMMDLLFGENAVTDEELTKLIAKRPEHYGRFSGYLGTRNKGILCSQQMTDTSGPFN